MARVAFVLPDMAGGGAERVTLTLIREFLACGHSVDLLLMRKAGELIELVPQGVRLIDLTAPRMRNALYPLWRYFRRERLDAVHVALWPLTAIAIAAHRLAGSRSRIVVSEHVALSDQYGGSRRTMMSIRATSRLLYKRANARVCVSKGAAKDLAGLSGLPLNAFSVIYNPIVAPSHPVARNLEVEQLWGGAERRIITVGRLTAEKNHRLLINAFARLADKAARLMIVGDGPLRGELERQAREFGVSDRVIMPGFFADPWPFYASADLFVLSSDYEGYGLVLVEAMLAGLRIISTDCPTGPGEILDHGQFGRLVPCGDPQALADAITASFSAPHDPEQGRRRADALSGTTAVVSYLELMLGESPAEKGSARPGVGSRL